MSYQHAFNNDPIQTIDNIYDNEYNLTSVKNRELELAQQRNKSIHNHNIIPPFENRGIYRETLNTIENNNDSRYIESLSGIKIPKNQFTFNNMVPFIGSKITQNMDMNAHQHKLETFSGNDDSTRIPKQSIPYMFPVRKEFTFHKPGISIEQSDYIQPSIFHQGIRPYEEVHVPRGIGKGFTTNADPG